MERPRVVLRLLELESRCCPTSLAVLGSAGINMLDMGQSTQANAPKPLYGLYGDGIRVGQIETGRPGLAPTDSLNHPQVVPTAVFDVDKTPQADNTAVVKVGVTYHPTKVASVIKATQLNPNDPYSIGAAQHVQLFSAAIGADALPDDYKNRYTYYFNAVRQAGGVPDPVAIKGLVKHDFMGRALTNLLGNQSPPLVAVNISTGSGRGQSTGNSQDALMLDYFSNQYNSLMVVANPNDQAEIDVGELGYTAAYDSIKVGKLTSPSFRPPNPKVLPDNYNEVFGVAPPPNGTRSLVDIVAPGDRITVGTYKIQNGNLTPSFDSGQDSKEGTSYATPLVTSAVALLAQYAKHNPNIFISVQAAALLDHKLLKAILLNSADVLDGQLPGPNGQAMQRTVYGLTGASWTQFNDVVDEYAIPLNNTPAAIASAQTLTTTRQNTPLNPEFGAGALDVARALVQLQGQQGGYQNPQTEVGNRGAIGWDTSALLDPNTWPNNLPPYPTQLVKDDPATNNVPYVVRKYQNLVPLKAGSYFEATLVGDRPVTMQTAQGVATNTYTLGNQFVSASGAQPPNLNLYLMPAGATSLSQAIWASTSSDSNVQHFFFQLPTKNTTTPDGRSLYSPNGYELWATTTAVTQTIPYAIAWWGVEQHIAPAPRAIVGQAWNDANGDGLMGPGESGLAGVNVNLLDANNNVVDSTTTDYMGNYEFDVPNGTYQVQFTSPAADTFTISNASDAAGDNNSQAIQDPNNPSIGTTGPITVSGNDVQNVDAGFVPVPLGAVSGQVWNDVNGNGVQPPPGSGAGFAGVTVDLFGADGTPYGSTTTDASGNYAFNGVAPGQYYVAVDQPVNAVFSPTGNGSASNVDPTTGRVSVI
jgi:hypothetical protein